MYIVISNGSIIVRQMAFPGDTNISYIKILSVGNSLRKLTRKLRKLVCVSRCKVELTQNTAEYAYLIESLKCEDPCLCLMWDIDAEEEIPSIPSCIFHTIIKKITGNLLSDSLKELLWVSGSTRIITGPIFGSNIHRQIMLSTTEPSAKIVVSTRGLPQVEIIGLLRKIREAVKNETYAKVIPVGDSIQLSIAAHTVYIPYSPVMAARVL